MMSSYSSNNILFILSLFLICHASGNYFLTVTRYYTNQPDTFHVSYDKKQNPGGVKCERDFRAKTTKLGPTSAPHNSTESTFKVVHCECWPGMTLLLTNFGERWCLDSSEIADNTGCTLYDKDSEAVMIHNRALRPNDNSDVIANVESDDVLYKGCLDRGHQLTLNGVSLWNDTTWSPLRTALATSIEVRTENSQIQWASVTPDSVMARWSFFKGTLVKISLKCQATNQQDVDSCFLLKFNGSNSYPLVRPLLPSGQDPVTLTSSVNQMSISSSSIPVSTLFVFPSSSASASSSAPSVASPSVPVTRSNPTYSITLALSSTPSRRSSTSFVSFSSRFDYDIQPSTATASLLVPSTVLGLSNTSFPVPAPSSDNDDAVIAVSVSAAVLLLILVVIIVFVLWTRARRHKKPARVPQPPLYGGSAPEYIEPGSLASGTTISPKAINPKGRLNRGFKLGSLSYYDTPIESAPTSPDVGYATPDTEHGYTGLSPYRQADTRYQALDPATLASATPTNNPVYHSLDAGNKKKPATDPIYRVVEPGT